MDPVSLEFYVVFEAETGKIRWKGQGAPGIAEMQVLPDGLSYILVSEDQEADPLTMVVADGEDGLQVIARSVSEAEVLANLKRDTLAAIKQRRDIAEWGGCNTPLGRVNTDPDSQRKISGAVSMAMVLGDTFTVDWRMEDDSVETHDKDAMITMGVLVGQHVSLCQANKNVLDAAINGAASAADIEAIEIDAGWPE